MDRLGDVVRHLLRVDEAPERLIRLEAGDDDLRGDLLAALERNAPAGHVIFSDVSGPSLDDCRAEFAGVAATDRASFGLASATDLAGIDSEDVDVPGGRAGRLFIQERPRACAD